MIEKKTFPLLERLHSGHRIAPTLLTHFRKIFFFLIGKQTVLESGGLESTQVVQIILRHNEMRAKI